MARFIYNPAFPEQMRSDPRFVAMVRAHGERVREAAYRLAPFESGDYRDSLKVVVERGRYVVVATDDFAGHLIEYGSVNNPPYAPLRRGVRAAGLRLEERPKGG